MKVVFGILLTAVSAMALNQDGLPGFNKTLSAKTLGHGRMGAGVLTHIATDERVIQNKELTSSNQTRTLGDGSLFSLSLYPALSFGLSNYFDIAVGLPVYLDDVDAVPGAQTDKLTIGDFRYKFKFQVPYFAERHVADVAVFFGGRLPTAERGHGLIPRDIENFSNNTSGESPIFGWREPAIDYGLALTIDFGAIEEAFQFKWHNNIGTRKTFETQADQVLYYSMALDYRITQFLSALLEFQHESRFEEVGNPNEFDTEPTTINAATTIHSPVGLDVQLGLSFALNRDYIPNTFRGDGTPAYDYGVRTNPDIKVLAGVSWTGWLVPQDHDNDGIINKLDACPMEPEDKDNFQDQDGCPDPDNDQDGISDKKDACPNTPEDVDGFQDEDGCPDTDNDEDGIPDAKDACPNQPEDLDGFEDADGCPDLDNDKDGISDSTDKCPNQPEDLDGFEDEDGCPDIDNDGDGVVDEKDKCPNEAGVPENDGCPEKVEKPKEIEKNVTLHGVKFKTGSAELTFESQSILNHVVEQLKAYPEVEIEIRGHTDNVGNNASNQRLSERRAQSVVDYLVSQGVERNRMKARGYGEEQPVAPNTNAQGRAENRRIEMYRTK